MIDEMSTEQLLRYERFARFYEIQRAIDKTTDAETLKMLNEQKEELIQWLETR